MFSPQFIRRKTEGVGCTKFVKNYKFLQVNASKRRVLRWNYDAAHRAQDSVDPDARLPRELRQQRAGAGESVGLPANFQGVYVSPQQAKALLNVLQQNVTQYETAFGEIRLEPQAGGGIVQ